MIVKTSREDESSKGFGFAKMFSSWYGLSQAGADAFLMANTEGQIKIRGCGNIRLTIQMGL